MARLRPRKQIELEGKHFNLRVVLLALSLVIAISAFAYGIRAALTKQTGWQTVDHGSDTVNCGDDFTLQYDFGASGLNATAEYKQVSALYTTGVEEGYRLFYREGALSGISAKPNTAVTVDPALYCALELLQSYGNRSIYLAPVYAEYDRMFLCETEGEAALYDPGQNASMRDYVNKIAAFVSDPLQIQLELLGDNTVRLRVSDAYLAFAQENGITEFLDLGWMKNAFIADYIAQLLIDGGYTRGYLASYDGFTRNLDSSGQDYSFNLFDRLEDVVYRPAVMHYSGATAIVYLRNYPLSDADHRHYYAFSGGRIATAFLDPADGMSKSATDNLVLYSGSAGCAELLLQAAPIFLADTLDGDALEALAARQTYAVWFQGTTLMKTDPALQLTKSEDAATAGYVIE